MFANTKFEAIIKDAQEFMKPICARNKDTMEAININNNNNERACLVNNSGSEVECMWFCTFMISLTQS
jgi:hypothetical protein